MNKTPLIVSFSGGRTSAYMCHILLNDLAYKDQYEYHFIFANTGKEKEETLIFVDKCDKFFGLNLVWVEASVNPERGVGTSYKIVNFETASRNGEPFEDMIKKYGISNKAFPHCTRELKTRPIHKYVKENISTEYKTAIGIRIDEARRAKIHSKEFVYPLLRQGLQIAEKGIREFWNKMPFDLGLKGYEGNCDLCWKKSANKKMQIIRDNPQVAEWWKQMENKYSMQKRYCNNTEGPFYLHRGNESTQSLIERSKAGKEVVDPHHVDNDESACTCRETFSEEERLYDNHSDIYEEQPETINERLSKNIKL